MRITLLTALLLTLGCDSDPQPAAPTAESSEAEGRDICDPLLEGNPEGFWEVLSDEEAEVEELWKRFNAEHREADTRSLMVFIDGTGNEKSSKTNIWKLFSLAARHGCGHPVIPHYQRGVGTRALRSALSLAGKPKEALQQLFGSGTDELIKNAYGFLAEAYRPGDRVFIFGFSRGALAARSLNGMLEFVGLLDWKHPVNSGQSEKDIDDIIQELWKAYNHKNDGKPHFEERHFETVRKKTAEKNYKVHDVTLEAIGVFDTVAALGVGRDDNPDDHRTSRLYANNGYHALAIDEQRNDFRPLRFDSRLDFDMRPRDGNSPRRVLQEVWFPGAHADVGGGYGDHAGLELVSRLWMLEKFKEKKWDVFASPVESCAADSEIASCGLGELHDEFLPEESMFNKFGIHWRRPAKGETLHSSALCRWKAGAALPSRHPLREKNGYRPENLHLPLEESYEWVALPGF